MTKTTITANQIDGVCAVVTNELDNAGSGYEMSLAEMAEAKRWMHIGLCWDGISADQLDRIRVEAWGVHGRGPIPDAMRAHASMLRSSEAEQANRPTSPEARPSHGRFAYFVDGTKYEHNASSISGALVRSRIRGLPPSYGLFLEGRGPEADRPISEIEAVSLEACPPHLYTAPPATWGRP